MKLFPHELRGQIRLYVRSRELAFFTFLFPIMLFVLLGSVYGEDRISERHRHRWEVNPAYHAVLQEHGMVFSGMSPDRRLVEVIELPDHPYFMAGQFHPELKSRPTRPHPMFREFVGAALALKSGALPEPVSLR